MITKVLLVENGNDGEVAGVFMPREKNRAASLARSLYAQDGGTWRVVDGSAAVEGLPLDENKCHICGLELDPSQPFDGHRDCREQE